MSVHPSANTLECKGCGSLLPDRTHRWCDRCVGCSTHIRQLTSSAELLRTYGLAEAASAVGRALEEIRAQLRTGAGPARDVAAARERARDRRGKQNRLAQSLYEQDRRAQSLYEMVVEDELPPCDDYRWPWAISFVQRLDDATLDLSATALLPAFRRFVREQLAERARAAATEWSLEEMRGSWPQLGTYPSEGDGGAK